MIRPNMSRDEIEFVGANHAGPVRQGDGYLILRILGNSLIKVPADDESLVPGLKMHGYWEAWISSWMTKNVKPSTTFYDVGANVGYFSVLASELGAHVEAFEPNWTLVNCLRTTKAANAYSANIWRCGLSDDQDLIQLYVPGNLLGSASTSTDFSDRTDVSQQRTWVFPLDYHPQKPFMETPDIIKMDIEGGEEKAWDGMQETLAKYSPTVVLEYTSGRYSADFPQKLHDYGDLYVINTEGEEDKISKDDLETFPEFEMVVVRP